MKITCFDDLATKARNMTRKTVLAVVEAHDEHTLESVVKAAREDIMIPVLIGHAKKIAALLSQYGADPTTFHIIESGGADESLQTAVELVNAGTATAVMKGMLDSGQFIKAIVSKRNNMTQGGLLSVCGFYETPRYHKLFAVSDMALNLYPDLTVKTAILKNAVGLFHALGNERPKVAVLSSVEKVNPKMPDTVDGQALKRMNQDGEITGCIIEGPISFDLATAPDAAVIKGYESPVAGDADLLLVPDIVSGNILAKCLTGFCGAVTAGNVLGAKVPVILTSRAAEASDKYYSIALAACAAGHHT